MSENFFQRQAPSNQARRVTSEEQDALRHKRVAIAGMAGAGVTHLLPIARLSVGKPRADVLAKIARKNKPAVEIKAFLESVGKSYRSGSLDGAGAPVESDMSRGNCEAATGDRLKPGHRGTQR